MKNLFLLLSCLLCLQACNDEKEVDWTPDALTVSCNETLEEAGDGHWKVTLPTEYKGSVTLGIKTDKAWKVEVLYMTNEKEEWITPSVQGGVGAASLSLVIADNVTAKDRKASVVITTKGEIPVKKIVTIIQGNVEELLTVGTIDESEFPEEVFITEKADGAFSVTLPKDFTETGDRELKLLTYEGTASPVIDIDFPNEDNQSWIELKEDVVAQIDTDTKVLSLLIKENTTNVYREAMINFTATAGDITVRKSVSVIQFGIEEIIWNSEYYQQEREFIVSSDANEKILVATCKNINPADIEMSGENEWLTLSQEDGKVYAEVTANISTNKERTAKIGVKNVKTGMEGKIDFRQGMKGYGIILNKSTWNIPAYSTNISSQYSETEMKKYFPRLYDNVWWDTGLKENDIYVEFNKGITTDGGADGKPYVLVFDLGENLREYNSFGIVPRLQWTAPAPKTVQIEVSDDLNEGWITVVTKNDSNGFTEAELKGATGSYNNHGEGIIHWFELGKLQKRYIRLTIYETFWNKKVLCLDEVFVSDRSNVVE